ncbi:MAG: helix-turn-helix transcriptional regulator [Nitrospira sp.]|nr:helix-turn-helix transcriptional regulator [Nitrospira sp.]
MLVSRCKYTKIRICPYLKGRAPNTPRSALNGNEHLLVRADLMIQVQKLIASRRLKQKAAAKILGVTQPRVSDLLRGRLDLFSTDALIDLLVRLGAEVRLKVRIRAAA